MLKWFKKLAGSEPQGINPPWQVGQYVTYFLERSDGTWTAFALKLLGKLEDESWVMTGDFKTASGECTVWFRSNPAAQDGELDIAPVKQEIVRKSPEANTDNVQDDPTMQSSLALNLLLVSRWPAAHELLKTEPRAASYPCGVDLIRELVTDGPGYKKHHALNARVMLTGVACLAIDGAQSPLIATSFGRSDPEVQGSAGHEDFVDLSHPKKIEHEGFLLTYPATWFLRPEATPDGQPAGLRSHVAYLGGNARTASCSVTVHGGAADQVMKERESIIARLGKPINDTPAGRWLLRPGDPLRLAGDARGFVCDRVPDGSHGVAYYGVFTSANGDRVAQVNLIGLASDANPRPATVLAEMEPAFRGIVESFSFT